MGDTVVRGRYLCQIMGIAAVAFGLGVLLSFFLPEAVLAVLEALLLAGAGLLYILKK